MFNYNNLLQRLRRSPRIYKSSLNQVTRQQGAYILWFDDNPIVCLKVGIAGPRKGKGLWERISYHFSSNLNNTVLARHMAVDIGFGKKQGYNFSDWLQRQQFLSDKCFFQVIPLPNLTRRELRRFEDFLELQLNPKYCGRVS